MENNSIQTKNAFFFSHDSNARNDQKITRIRMHHGAEGYGIYFMLIELLMESTNYMLTSDSVVLAFNLQVNKEVLKSVIEDFDLFESTEDGKHIFSPSLNKRIAPLEQIREKRRQAGIRSGEVRREKMAKMANEESIEAHDADITNTCSTNVAKKRTEESREEKSKEEKSKVEESRAQCAEVAVALPTASAACFVPPSRQEIERYCIENKYNIRIDTFFDFYQSNGWMVGQNPMRDWQATVRKWEQKDRENARKRRHGLPLTHRPNITNHKNSRAYERF